MTTADLQLAEPPAAHEQRRASDTQLHPGTDPPLEATEIARWITPQIAESVIELMRRRRPIADMTAADGQLRLELRVLIEGGVTEEHLRAQLKSWRGVVAMVTAMCRRMAEDAGD